MTINNGNTEDERLDNMKSESANTKDNRGNKLLQYWPKYKITSDIKQSLLFKEQNKILMLFLKN